jgi:predicted secreted protein
MVRLLSLCLPFIAAAAMAQPVQPRTAHYLGILPCANCPALRVQLTLHADAAGKPTRYEQRWTYLDVRGKDRSRVTRGPWKLEKGTRADASAAAVRLLGEDPQLMVRDGERALRIVDTDGRDMPSPRPQILWLTDGLRPPITVTEADVGRTIQLRPGEEILVRLKGNPTTGYRWMPHDEGPSVLELSGTPAFKRDAAREGMTGVGGEETWRFAAMDIGVQTLELRYQRSWEADAVRSVSFQVEVR